ncbi:hypothetical protein NDU88_001910 [Pleurodeles waltl]|uniref:Uncharacterized protein n=1 Tax=Pleurodeles waltl TaxID=8319 RepID=A0AAV7P585_PLEWA|nr:hypothetical protein NDU88_001910 [Pleurodeles waltl]
MPHQEGTGLLQDLSPQARSSSSFVGTRAQPPQPPGIPNHLRCHTAADAFSREPCRLAPPIHRPQRALPALCTISQVSPPLSLLLLHSRAPAHHLLCSRGAPLAIASSHGGDPAGATTTEPCARSAPRSPLRRTRCAASESRAAPPPGRRGGQGPCLSCPGEPKRLQSSLVVGRKVLVPILPARHLEDASAGPLARSPSPNELTALTPAVAKTWSFL